MNFCLRRLNQNHDLVSFELFLCCSIGEYFEAENRESVTDGIKDQGMSASPEERKGYVVPVSLSSQNPKRRHKFPSSCQCLHVKSSRCRRHKEEQI